MFGPRPSKIPPFTAYHWKILSTRPSKHVRTRCGGYTVISFESRGSLSHGMMRDIFFTPQLCLLCAPFLSPSRRLSRICNRLAQAEAQAAVSANNGREGGGGDAPAETPSKAVSIRGMVGPRHGGLAVDTDDAPQLSEVHTHRTAAGYKKLCSCI